jgi:hypothetical protein
MATLVPLFAWGIVKGGMAVTDLITRGLSNQIMSQAGNVAATGNVTLGNESMNDNTIDQNMLMPKYSVGYGMATATVDGNGFTEDSAYSGTRASVAGYAVSATQALADRKQAALDYSKADSYGIQVTSNVQKAASLIGEVSNSSGITGTDVIGGHNQGQAVLREGHAQNTGNTKGSEYGGQSGTNTSNSTSNASGYNGGGGISTSGLLEGAGVAATLMIPEARVPELVGEGAGDTVAVAEDGKLPGILNEVRTRLLKTFGSKTTKAAMLGGVAATALDPHAEYSLKQLNTEAKGSTSNLGGGYKDSNDTSSKYNKNNDAQVISQGINTLQTTLSNGTKYTKTQRAQLSKALSYLKTSKMDLQKKEQYQSAASAAETVNMPQSVSQKQPLLLRIILLIMAQQNKQKPSPVHHL